MPKDVNEYIVDDFTRHSIDLDRFSVGERNDTLKALRGLEKELVAKLKNSAKLTSFQAARTEALLQQTQATIAKRYTKIGKARKKSLDIVYANEKEFVVQTYNNRIGSDVMTVFVDENVVRRAVDNTLIQGAPSSFWWKNQSAGLQDRFESAVRTGILAGETNDEIARRVRGTAANNFTDGVMSVSKKQADALVRTSVQAVANRARMDTYEENVDIIAKIQQRSTLDTRTTNICKSYAGLTWRMIRKEGGGVNYVPVGHDKSFANIDRDGVLHYGPPRHWQCRSVLVPLTASWEDLATKPVKPKGQRKESFQKKFEARLKKRGFTPEQIAAQKAKTRASMGGQVPGDLNYEQWLKTQSKTRQVEALGPERWKLWNEGKIKNFSQLTDNQGRPLTIDQYTQRTVPPKSKPKPKPPLPPKPKPVIPPPSPKPPKPKPLKPPSEPNNDVIDAVVAEQPTPFQAPFKKALKEQTEEYLNVVAATPKVKTVTFSTKTGAHYARGPQKINLHKSGWSSTNVTTTHEFTHHIDGRAGKALLPGTANSNLDYASSLAFEAMQEESRTLMNTINKLGLEKAKVSGEYLWANAMRTAADRDRKWKLNLLSQMAFNKGYTDEYVYILKNMKGAKPDRIAWVLQQLTDKQITIAGQGLNRIQFVIDDSVKAIKNFPAPANPWIAEWNKAKDKVEFMDKEAAKMFKAGTSPFTAAELKKLAPTITDRAELLQAIKHKDAETFLTYFTAPNDTYLSGTGRLKLSVEDYFGSVTKRGIGDGHELSYYTAGETFNTVGARIGERQTAEAFADYFPMVTRKQDGELYRKIYKFFTPKTVEAFDKIIDDFVKSDFKNRSSDLTTLFDRWND